MTRKATCTCPLCTGRLPLTTPEKHIQRCSAGGDFGAWYEAEYLGSYATSQQARQALDDYVYELLNRGLIPTATELAHDRAELRTRKPRLAIHRAGRTNARVSRPHIGMHCICPACKPACDAPASRAKKTELDEEHWPDCPERRGKGSCDCDNVFLGNGWASWASPELAA